ncbi:uncharacterized protein LOC143367749 isoform X3 [Andrena cerasifolii]|uniref:uncharacterized protein LOC143367749 isoform X3 n=1 Tax=Andrena cerasifolii TaxID=2819439 RepID=UPI004037D0C8
MKSKEHDLQKMESIINDLQADYANVPISGLFLVYPQYYIHVLETSEDIIYKHLKALYDDKSEDCRFGKSIFLPFYHHVHQTLFTEWFHVYTVPPTLLDKLESYELTDIQKQVANCLEKVYTLCESITNTARDYTASGRHPGTSCFAEPSRRTIARTLARPEKPKLLRRCTADTTRSNNLPRTSLRHQRC